jgi:hypothetical protein
MHPLMTPPGIGVRFAMARVEVDALAEFLKHCAGHAWAGTLAPALIQSTWPERTK